MILERLRRVTTGGRWIPEIDGLRFIAISAVVIFHLSGTLELRPEYRLPVEPSWWWFKRLLANGYRGVPLFFVISGIVLSLPFAHHYLLGDKAVSLRKYFLRRVTRLEPPYILSLLLVAAISFVYWHAFPAGYARHFFMSALYQHTLFYGYRSTVSGVTWSLEIEIQFYLLAPCFMQIYRIRATAFRRCVLLATVALLSAVQIPIHWGDRFEFSLLNYLQYFLMGLLVADLLVLDGNLVRRSWRWDFLGIAAIAGIFWPMGSSHLIHALLPLPIALLCLAGMRSHILRRFLAIRWISIIGGMCYSIYLLHMVFLSAILKVTHLALIPGGLFVVNLAIQTVIAAVPTVAICAVFFVFVERPCMDPNWPSTLWHKLSKRRIESPTSVIAATRE